jgi:uncharacterized alkaline shock family protein YloU
MGEHATISTDILASYAADAALEVDGVRALVERHLPRHRGVRVTDDGGRVSFELHLAVDWGVSIPQLGREVQARVAEYLVRMADLDPAKVDVVVDEVGAP